MTSGVAFVHGKADCITRSQSPLQRVTNFTENKFGYCTVVRFTWNNAPWDTLRRYNRLWDSGLRDDPLRDGLLWGSSCGLQYVLMDAIKVYPRDPVKTLPPPRCARAIIVDNESRDTMNGNGQPLVSKQGDIVPCGWTNPAFTCCRSMAVTVALCLGTVTAACGIVEPCLLVHTHTRGSKG